MAASSKTACSGSTSRPSHNQLQPVWPGLCEGLLSFDDRNRLWVWDGAKAIALRFAYDSYLLDEATRAIYLTDPVDGLTIDGVIV